MIYIKKNSFKNRSLLSFSALINAEELVIFAFNIFFNIRNVFFRNIRNFPEIKNCIETFGRYKTEAYTLRKSLFNT